MTEWRYTAHFTGDNMGCSELSDPWAQHAIVNRHVCYVGGGSGSSGGTQTSTTTTKQELSPEQRQLLGAAMPALTGFAFTPPKDFPGEKIVPFNPLEIEAQGLALGAARGSAQDIADRAATSSAFLSGPNLYAESNPYLQSAIAAAVRPQKQAFGETILPGIRTGAATSGQFGGSRQGIAEGIASRGLLDSISDTAGRLSNANYQAGQDAMVRALALAPQTQQLQLMPSSVVAGVGAQQRSLAQAQLDEEIQRFMNAQLLPYLAAKDVAGIAFGLPGGGSTVTAIGPTGYQGPSALSSGLGGAASGAAIGSLFGPWGTGIGAGLGGLFGLLGGR